MDDDTNPNAVPNKRFWRHIWAGLERPDCCCECQSEEGQEWEVLWQGCMQRYGTSIVQNEYGDCNLSSMVRRHMSVFTYPQRLFIVNIIVSISFNLDISNCWCLFWWSDMAASPTYYSCSLVIVILSGAGWHTVHDTYVFAANLIVMQAESLEMQAALQQLEAAVERNQALWVGKRGPGGNQGRSSGKKQHTR